MDKAISIFIDVFTKNPLTVTLAVIGALCIVLAIIGKIPPLEITALRQVFLAGFGFLLIVVAIVVAWILTPSQPLLQQTTSAATNSTQPTITSADNTTVPRPAQPSQVVNPTNTVQPTYTPYPTFTPYPTSVVALPTNAPVAPSVPPIRAACTGTCWEYNDNNRTMTWNGPTDGREDI